MHNGKEAIVGRILKKKSISRSQQKRDLSAKEWFVLIISQAHTKHKGSFFVLLRQYVSTRCM